MPARCLKAATNLNHFPFTKSILHLPKSPVKSLHLARSINRCTKPRDLESLYTTMVKSGLDQDCFLTNQFITACSSFNNVKNAVLAYTQMENPNVFVYNAMITALVRWNFPVKAIEVHVRMLKSGVVPSSYTFSALIKACGLVFDLRLGECVHGHVWKNGFASHVFVQTALVDFYSGLARKAEFIKVFDEMPERDVFAWTTMVSGFLRIGDLGSARLVFDVMPERSIATWNTLLDGYARMRNVEAAEDVFNQMPARDIISWTTMINCYSQNQWFREALGVFNEMMKNGIGPDAVTLATVISACAHLGALDIGREIHHFASCNGFGLDVYIGSALVDMYAKCGCLERSILVFFKLQEKNLFCWNSVIEGLASHGCAKMALVMFSKMEREKIKPNSITFISMLSACSHAGLVEEGHQRFHSMIHDYLIEPEVAHYGCMVDLLAKAGLLVEALELIRAMNCKPNAVIWGALLGGCKLQKNLEIAQIAVNELIVLEPDNSGYYSLLVSIYAEIGKWDEAAKVRMFMKELGVEKRCPGFSWLEMECKVHQFASSDTSHIASDEIYNILTEMDGQMKFIGYLPDQCSTLSADVLNLEEMKEKAHKTGQISLYTNHTS